MSIDMLAPHHWTVKSLDGMISGHGVPPVGPPRKRVAVLLPQTAEYALRAMAHLVSQPRDTGVRASDLSEATGIPLAYLSKILRRLVVAGLLGSKKGHGGGFVLVRAPERVSFLEVLDAVDFDADPSDCAFGWSRCDPNHPCPLHPTWSRLKDTFRTWAAETTLQTVLAEATAARAPEIRARRAPAAKRALAERKRRASKAKSRRGRPARA